MHAHALAAATPANANEALLQAFDSYLARQARSDGTRRKYGEALACYSRWLNERNPGSVRADEIDSYLQHWRDRFEQRRGRPPASGSYRAQINALRAFYAYLDRFTLITNQDGQPLPYPMRKILPPTPKRSNQQRLAPTRRRPSTPALPRQPARMLPDRTAALERPARRRSHQPHPRRHRHKRRPGSDHRPPQQNQRGQTNDPDRPRARTAPPRLARLSRLARP